MNLIFFPPPGGIGNFLRPWEDFLADPERGFRMVLRLIKVARAVGEHVAAVGQVLVGNRNLNNQLMLWCPENIKPGTYFNRKLFNPENIHQSCRGRRRTRSSCTPNPRKQSQP